MWTELEATSLKGFFGFREEEVARPGTRGRVFLSCSHLSSIEKSFEATRKLAASVASVMTIPKHSLVLSVYGPVVYQGLPDVMATLFSMNGGARRRRYYYPASAYAYREDGYVESWFNFEGDGPTLEFLLGEKSRIAWGSGIALAGLQTLETRTRKVLKACPFEQKTISRLEGLVQSAFLLNNDVNEVSVFLTDGPHHGFAERLGIIR